MSTYTKSELMQIVKDAWNRERSLQGVDVGLGWAICDHESGWNPEARSPTTATDEKYGGAWGLCQILVDTARGLHFVGTPEELWNPHINAWLLARLTAQNVRQVGNLPYNIIAAHNAGAEAVKRGRVPAETMKTYVPEVFQLYLKHYLPLKSVVPASETTDHPAQSGNPTTPPPTPQTGTPSTGSPPSSTP